MLGVGIKLLLFLYSFVNSRVKNVIFRCIDFVKFSNSHFQ